MFNLNEKHSLSYKANKKNKIRERNRSYVEKRLLSQQLKNKRVESRRADLGAHDVSSYSCSRDTNLFRQILTTLYKYESRKFVAIDSNQILQIINAGGYVLAGVVPHDFPINSLHIPMDMLKPENDPTKWPDEGYDEFLANQQNQSFSIVLASVLLCVILPLMCLFLIYYTMVTYHFSSKLFKSFESNKLKIIDLFFDVFLMI